MLIVVVVAVIVIAVIMVAMDDHNAVMMIPVPILIVMMKNHNSMMMVLVVVAVAYVDGYAAFLRNNHRLVASRGRSQRRRAQDCKRARDKSQFVHVMLSIG